MPTVIVYAPNEGYPPEPEFAVWVCDLLNPGQRIAHCPTRAIANSLARLYAFSRGYRFWPLEPKKRAGRSGSVAGGGK